MNKLTKVGCSALCGSLAAIAGANAGDLTATGSAQTTWVSKGGDVTGNPLGFNSGFSLIGEGELDNGYAYKLTLAHKDAGVWSAASINMDMGGLGSLRIDQGTSGNGIAAMDDKMPTAWEESWGAGLSTGIRGLVVGAGASMNVQYTTPTIAGTTLTLTYAPQHGVTDTAEKTTAVNNTAAGSAYDATININPSFGTEILSGLNIFGGATTVEYYEGAVTDTYQAVGGFTYALGPMSIGAQVSGEYTGVDDNKATAVSANNLYKANAFGIAFNVNDNLSVSYGEWESRMSGYTSTSYAQIAEADRTITVESTQVSYSMGGASINLASITAENTFFGTTAIADKKATVISLGLAF